MATDQTNHSVTLLREKKEFDKSMGEFRTIYEEILRDFKKEAKKRRKSKYSTSSKNDGLPS